jgi:hypothetical protein
MRVFRRFSLVAFALVAPPAAAALLYAISVTLLRVTHRIIDPQILWYGAAIELPVFFFFAVLEAKNRW